MSLLDSVNLFSKQNLFSETMGKKFIKIWTSSTKKAVVCSDLDDMIVKGGTKLGINSQNLKAFLEDGTEVDDEEIFEALPAGSVVYLFAEDEEV